MSVSRDLVQKIGKDLKTDEILVFMGARQVGKTTLLKQLLDQLESNNEVCHFLNLEDPDYLSLLNQSPKNLLKIIALPANKRAVVFVDEVQYLDNPTNFLKYFYDEYKGKIKLIVSGSSAFYIDKKFKDSLAGRKRIFTLNTLSFREFLRFKNEESLLSSVPQSFSLKNIDFKSKVVLKDYEKLKLYFDEYTLYGGYPRVVLADMEEKELVLQDIAYSYLKKDLYDSDVRQPNIFYKLMKILASQVGGLVNANELANTLGTSRPSIDHYLHVMEKGFHISLLRPFFKNARKELTKMPKVYFKDVGLRNFFSRNFDPITLRPDKGALFENVVFRSFLERFDDDKIKFWRTQSGHEIDFIIDEKYAFEAKFTKNLIRPQKNKYWQKHYPDMPVNFVVNEKPDSKHPFSLWEPWEL